MQKENKTPHQLPTEVYTKKKKAPKWLKALEAQSWQAELLISGLVIAGLLQLPEIIIHWVEGYMLESGALGHGFLGFASMYFLAGLNALIICFGIHFLLRSIWIALLGLNSVYPDGINTESKAGGGPVYWRKTKEKYPNLSAYNQELDNRCSTIFSIATMIIIFTVSLSALIIGFYQLFSFLGSLFPILITYIVPIGISLYVVFMVLAIFRIDQNLFFQ